MVKYTASKKDWINLGSLLSQNISKTEEMAIIKQLNKLEKKKVNLEEELKIFVNNNQENENIVDEYFLKFNEKIGRFSDETEMIPKDLNLSEFATLFYLKKAFELSISLFQINRQQQNETLKIKCKLKN